jgi:sulfatase maturation enzyme AslB (radical SAM superfamily)
MTKSPWCPLPWTHLGVKNNGTLRMCSHSQSGGNKNTTLSKDGKELTIEDLKDIDVLNCDTLKQVRKDFLEGQWPEQCRRCHVESSAGHRSRDQWETIRHAETFTKERALEITQEDGTTLDPHIQSYDLRLGNHCNLRCVMCFPGEATKWYNDYNEIIGETEFTVDNRRYTLDPKDGDFDWVKKEDKVNSLLDASGRLNKIKFGGGEPLMIKHHYDLLKGLIERGYAKDIELEYSSNVTVFPEVLFEYWKHFKVIKICASIDALFEANEAIRYPSKWSAVEKNLRMLDTTDDNIVVFTSITISILSLEYLSRLMIWLYKQNFKKINNISFKLTASHPVYAPYYLNIAILDQHQKDRIFADLQREINEAVLDTNAKENMLSKIDFYSKYYDFMKIKDARDYQKQFCERFFRFAKNQKQDWTKIFPVAHMLIEEWQSN